MGAEGSEPVPAGGIDPGGGTGPDPAAGATPPPSQPLPRAARGLFVLQGLASAAPLVLLALFAGAALADAGAPDAVGLAVQGIGAVGALAGTVALSLLRWRRWRYELRDEEIDLLRGAVVVTRTLIPVVRVQHVDTRRTWLSDQFGLRAVVVHTAGGSHTIPALDAEQAAAIRDRIARLARQPDDV